MPVFAATGGGSSGGSFLVQPDVGLMIWCLIAFGVAYFILSKFAFPRIADGLDKRQRAIDESIDHAERTRKEADALLAEYRERLAEARSQADEIVARARRTGETVEAEAVAEAKVKREELLEQTRREIQTETNRALGDIRSQVADMTVLATEKVARARLNDDDQRRLVEDALSELDFKALAGDKAGA